MNSNIVFFGIKFNSNVKIKKRKIMGGKRKKGRHLEQFKQKKEQTMIRMKWTVVSCKNMTMILMCRICRSFCLFVCFSGIQHLALSSWFLALALFIYYFHIFRILFFSFYLKLYVKQKWQIAWEKLFGREMIGFHFVSMNSTTLQFFSSKQIISSLEIVRINEWKHEMAPGSNQTENVT